MNESRDPLTELAIGAAIEVHRIMRPGLLESAYQQCMEEELRLRECPVEVLYRIPLQYKGVPLGDEVKIDLFFPGRLVVELKAVEKLHPVREAQLLTYLRLSQVHVGLLINFNVPTLVSGLKRMVL